MARRELTRDERIERVRDVLAFRSGQLEAERATATPRRVKKIDAELAAIEERQALVYLAEAGGLEDLRELGKPLPLAARKRSISTPDGYRIETIDTGKRIACRYWKEGERRPKAPGLVCTAGPYMPCLDCPMETIEHTAWCIVSGWRGDE